MVRSLCVVAAAALLGACDRPPDMAQREKAAAALQGVLAYPGSTPLTVSAGEDAGQVSFATPAAVRDVAAWYRLTLRLNAWELRSDAVTGDGTISIYAVKGQQPLWILLKPNVGGPGTTYTLIGAVPGADSSAAQRSGSSMSSKRIQRR